jgi:hypothetical protein
MNEFISLLILSASYMKSEKSFDLPGKCKSKKTAVRNNMQRLCRFNLGARTARMSVNLTIF